VGVLEIQKRKKNVMLSAAEASRVPPLTHS
jgi:hypothetical protein